MVDALDAAAVEGHLEDVVAATGRVDVSFNLISRGDPQGTPLVRRATEDLARAVVNGLTSSFVTARAAAQYVIARRYLRGDAAAGWVQYATAPGKALVRIRPTRAVAVDRVGG